MLTLVNFDRFPDVEAISQEFETVIDRPSMRREIVNKAINKATEIIRQTIKLSKTSSFVEFNEALLTTFDLDQMARWSCHLNARMEISNQRVIRSSPEARIIETELDEFAQSLKPEFWERLKCDAKRNIDEFIRSEREMSEAFDSSLAEDYLWAVGFLSYLRISEDCFDFTEQTISAKDFSDRAIVFSLLAPGVWFSEFQSSTIALKNQPKKNKENAQRRRDLARDEFFRRKTLKPNHKDDAILQEMAQERGENGKRQWGSLITLKRDKAIWNKTHGK